MSTVIVLGEQLHSHDGKNENDDNQDKHQVTKSSHCLPHNGNQQIQRRPGFRKLKHTQLKYETGLMLAYISECINNVRVETSEVPKFQVSLHLQRPFRVETA